MPTKRKNRSNSEVGKVSQLWTLLNPMDEDVRRCLNSSGLDRHVPQIAELGIETMEDLKNPYMITDKQLKSIGMSRLGIIRYRNLCSAPVPVDRDSIEDGSIVANEIEEESSIEGLGRGTVVSHAPFLPLLVELGIESYEHKLKDACGGDDSCRTLLISCPEARLCHLGVPLVKVL